MEQAAAAKRNEHNCRLTASRDIVEARLDAMAGANSKLETIAAENAVASMYAKEAGTIEANRRSSPPQTTKMKSRGAAQTQTTAAMARIDKALSEARMRRHAQEAQYAETAVRQGTALSPTLAESLARSHQLQEKMEDTFQKFPSTPSPFSSSTGTRPTPFTSIRSSKTPF